MRGKGKGGIGRKGTAREAQVRAQRAGRGPRRVPPPPRRQGEHPGKSSLWLFGRHAVLAALANRRRTCRRLLATEESCRREEASLAAALAERPLLQPEIVAREELESLLPPGALHQGLALEAAPLPPRELRDLLQGLPPGPAILVLLDQVTDPHNVGAILRSAAVFGAAAVITTERHAAGESGTLAKSASGALELLPYLQVANLAQSLERIKEAGFWVVGLAGEAERNLRRGELPDRLALCLGAEGTGLRRLTRERCDLLCALPAAGAFRDLNVSNAAAVALYELLGRRA